MAPKVLKRPSAAATPSPKRSRASPGSAACGEVASALESARCFAPSVVEMLRGALPTSLAVEKDQRHEFQHKLVEMVGQCLAEIERNIEADITDAQSALTGADAEKTQREDVLAVAASEATSKREALSLAESTVTLRSSALKVTKEALDASLAAQKKGGKDINASISRKTKLEALISDHVEAAKAAQLPKQQIKTLLNGLKDFASDASLLNSLPVALAKEPCERGAFDALVFQQLIEHLTAQLRDLARIVADGEPARVQRADDVGSSQNLHDRELAEKDQCAERVVEAKNALKASEESVAAANKAAASLAPELRRAATRLDAAKNEVRKLREGALQSFAELRDGKPAPASPALESSLPEDKQAAFVASPVNGASLVVPAVSPHATDASTVEA